MKRTFCLMVMMLVLTGLKAQIVRQVAFEGKLDGKTAVRVAFEENADKIVAGAIYYPKAKNPAQILIVGEHNSNGTYFE